MLFINASKLLPYKLLEDQQWKEIIQIQSHKAELYVNNNSQYLNFPQKEIQPIKVFALGSIWEIGILVASKESRESEAYW